MILRNIIVMMFVWTITGFSYYINNTFLKQIPGDFEINTLIANWAEILAVPVSTALFYNGISVKKLFFSYSLIVAVSGLGKIFFVDQEDPGMQMFFLVGLGRGGVMSAFTLLY